ncbi:MAG: glycosyltransferase family 2 protein [Christensenellaceae bacterium]|nr:glycosyltransferase family 2 protein [Christensenellaceae bacterium]
MSKTLLSFVVPCYNSKNTITAVVDEIINTVETRPNFDYEIILVADSSPDTVYDVIKNLAQTNPKIKGINFARNFGQHSAIMAGFRHSKGDIVFSLDDDGQTPADELYKLVDVINNGADIVFARYRVKKHNRFRNFVSKINSFMMETLTNKPKQLAVSSYFAVKRFIVNEMIHYKNPYPYLGGLIFRATSNVAHVDVEHRERVEGKSNYSFKKLLALWMNGFTAFSVKPLRISTYIGVITATFGFIYGLFIIIRKLVMPQILIGYSSLMAVLLFIGGMILLMLGMIGEYIGRIYICINESPQYVIKEKVNLEDDNGQ